MTKEQIEALADFIADGTVFKSNGFEIKITEWFEQNPIEPAVVGLSDEQKKSVINRFADNFCIQRYRVEQSFNDLYKNLTFKPQEVKEVVVGLSDEQVELLSKNINNCFESGFISFTPNDIKLWLKSQTFSQPDYTNGGWKGKYDSLRIDYDELKASKFQLFEPDWGIIPSYVDTVELVLNYFNCGECKFLHSYDRPKPLAPSVEICTRWKHKKSGVVYFVDCIGKQWVSENNWVESVTYRKTEISPADFFTKPIDDFLAKFERAS